MAVSVAVSRLTQRIYSPAFACRCIKEKPRRTVQASGSGLIKSLAIGILESDDTLPPAQAIAREAGSTGTISYVRGLAQRIEIFASSFSLTEEIASIATSAYSITIESFAEGIILTVADDASA